MTLSNTPPRKASRPRTRRAALKRQARRVGGRVGNGWQRGGSCNTPSINTNV